MIKAVLFDFNGTLFQDAAINKKIWKKILNELTNNKIDFESFYSEFSNTHNHLIINEIRKRYLNNKEIDVDYWSNKKEDTYKNYCLQHNLKQMTPGAEEFLNYLKENNIKIGLCTSSIIGNVNFYYKNLNLYRWFTMEHTIYDTGEYDSKSKMYLDCAKSFEENIKDCLIIEDSPRAIFQAIKAGCKKIIAIKNEETKNLEYEEIKQTINNFNELDYSILD